MAAGGLIAKATFEALLNGVGGWHPANGVVDLGPAEALEIIFGGDGADGDTLNYLVERIQPIYADDDSGNATPTGYLAQHAANGVVTLGATTVGAIGTAFGDSNIATDDVWGDTLTQLQATAYGLKGPFSPANDIFGASIIVHGVGCKYLRIRTDIATGPTDGWAIARKTFPLFS